MRAIEDMGYYTERNRDGKHIGRVREFSDLRSKPKTNILDAIHEIVDLTSLRIREIHERQAQ